MVTRILAPVRIPRPEFITGGCVLELKMDEGEGVVVHDSSGYGNHGDLKPGPAPNYPTWVDGKFGKALSFDGVDDYIVSASAISISGTGLRTLEFWSYVNAITVHPHLVGWGDQTALNTMFKAAIYSPTEGSGTWFLWGRGGGNDWDTQVAVVVGEWLHHTITYDGTTAEWFMNGVSKGTFTHSYNTTATTLEMGLGTTEGNPFKGLIDEVRIYNRALTAEEIKAHWLGSRVPKVRQL